MRAFIQTHKNGDYYNVNTYLASVGFDSLGFETHKYVDAAEVEDKDKASIFVGGVGMVRERLQILGIDIPKEIEYPEALRPFLHRKIWKSSLQQVLKEERTNIFIKPVETKRFLGKVIHQLSDFIGLPIGEDLPVWCSEVVDLRTEWRCFVRYGTLLDVRYYKGAWDSRLDLNIVKEAIASFSDQPTSYCLDFGVDASGQHYLVEVNDGHSLGSYGMGAISYAKFLSARWSELTQTEDRLNF
ncbi:MAG: ATP-grasp domain-containing protein [Bacteroidota bacterium]